LNNPETPTTLFQTILSRSVADRLHITKGGKVKAILSRKLGDSPQTENIELDVLDVLPLYLCNRDAIFVSLNFLVNVEDYRDGRIDNPFSNTVTTSIYDSQSPRLFAGYRLYANSIYDVLSLVTYIKKEGFNVYAKTSEIDMIIKLDKKLSLIFWTLTGIGCIGYFVSIGVNSWSNIERKKKEINILHLVGFSTQNIIFFPIIQAILISLIGCFMAGLLYFIAQYYINYYMMDDSAFTNVICDLYFINLFSGLIITTFIATLASFVAGYKAATLQPSSGLRNV
jgi:putative ABC transport system permease protein